MEPQRWRQIPEIYHQASERQPEVRKAFLAVACRVVEYFAILRETDKALDGLDRTVRNGDERADFFRRDPLLANVRQEPRFKQIVESIEYRRSKSQ